MDDPDVPTSCSTPPRSLDEQAPSYFGAAWIALGRLWLDTDLLGGCRPGAPTRADTLECLLLSESSRAGRSRHVAGCPRPPSSVPIVEMTFFETPTDEADGEWFTPTDHSRGPWDGDSCHAGPPTGLLVRSMERALPDVRLARITVELAKPIPMAGFHIAAEVTRRGRTVATTRATVVDGEGEVRATATGLHAAIQQPPLFDGPLDNSGVPTPRLADARPGPVPDRRSAQPRAPRVQR